MKPEKIKMTVRFVVEQDFEVEVRDPKLGLGSVFAVGDNMVSGGQDLHDVTTHENIFDNPVGEMRPLQGEHLLDTNLYTLGLYSGYVKPWLIGDEKDELDVEVDLEDEQETKLELVVDNDNEA